MAQSKHQGGSSRETTRPMPAPSISGKFGRRVRQGAALLSWLTLGSVCSCSVDSGEAEKEPSVEQTDETSPDEPATVETLIRGIAEEQILVDIEAFSAAALTLAESADALCEDPEQETLDGARENWRSAAGSWYRVQLFNFGPADADPIFPLFSFVDSLRVRGDDYTDTVSSTLDRWRSSDDTLDAEFFAAQRFDDVGLLALELALFESEDVLTELTAESRNCEVLSGLAHALRERGDELGRGWTEDYDDTGEAYVNLLIDDELPDGREPLVQIVISAQEYLDYLNARGIVALAGKVSDTGWFLLGQALDAVEELLSVDHGGHSLFFWMELLGDQAAVDKVQQDLADAREALEAQDQEALDAALAVLDGDFKREVPDSLGIELGLTFTDGD